MPDASLLCPSCGEPGRLDVLEYWPADRAFMLDTCCEDSNEFAHDEMRDWTRRDWQAFFASRLNETVKNVVIGEECATSGWALDFGLEIRPIEYPEARAFIALHHRHARVAPPGWLFGHACYNGAELIGVSMTGRPSSIGLDTGRMAQVARVCVLDYGPAAMRANACSMLYGAAARDAERAGYAWIITYTLDEESGRSLIAAGYRRVARTKGGSWSRADRLRTDKAPTEPKDRWQRDLDPNPRKLRPLRARFVTGQINLFQGA